MSISALKFFRRLRLSALLLATLGIASPALDAALVRGKLLFSNGAAAAQVAVRVRTAKGVSPFTYSGRDGMFYLNGIPAGSYTLEIWRSQVLVTSQAIAVHETITDVPVCKLP